MDLRRYYEEDVAAGSFNVYRCLIAIHGPVQAPTEMARMIAAAEAEYELAMGTLEPSLAARYRRGAHRALLLFTPHVSRPCTH